MKNWWVYIIRCLDESLYTGIARDPKKRFEQHKAGKGSKYIRSRGAKKIVYLEPADSQSDALRRELEIKLMTRAEKEKFISLVNGDY